MEKLIEQLVPFHIAKLLDHLQFNYHCQAFYNANGEVIFTSPIRNSELMNEAISAPTYQQATDFLRTRHKIHVAASPFPIYNGKYGYEFCRESLSGGWTPDSETYYGAFATGIQKAINLYLTK